MTSLSDHKWDTSQYTAIKNKHILVDPARYEHLLRIEKDNNELRKALHDVNDDREFKTVENTDLREQLLLADQRIKLLELQLQLKTNCKPA